MNQFSRSRFVLAFVILLLLLAGLTWVGWWSIRKAYVVSSGPFMVGVATAIICTAIISLTLHRNGAARATRIRSRAEAYENALALLLHSRGRQTNAERRRARARLLLWGSGAVLREFTDLEDEMLSAEDEQHDASDRLGVLIRLMRIDLGQASFVLAPNGESEEDDE